LEGLLKKENWREESALYVSVLFRLQQTPRRSETGARVWRSGGGTKFKGAGVSFGRLISAVGAVYLTAEGGDSSRSRERKKEKKVEKVSFLKQEEAERKGLIAGTKKSKAAKVTQRETPFSRPWGNYLKKESGRSPIHLFKEA